MALTNLRKEFEYAIAAAEAAIRIETDEIADAVLTVTQVCNKHGWELRVWDASAGTDWLCGVAPKKQANSTGNAFADQLNVPEPTNGIMELIKFLNEPAKPDPDVNAKGEVLPIVFVFLNFHLLFEQARQLGVATVQHLIWDKVGNHPDYPKLKTEVYDKAKISGDSSTGKFIVGVVPPGTQFPPEISPLFKKINHDPPDEAELGVIFDGIVEFEEDEEDDEETRAQKEEQQKEARRLACKYARGLTRLQAEGVFSTAMVQFGSKKNFAERLPKCVWLKKSEILNEGGYLTLYTGNETFEDVVGQKGLKALLKDLLKTDRWEPNNVDLRSKGIALVGPPRTGKSLTSKAIGNELGLPVLMIDVGALFGGFVGDSERNTRKMFQIVRAHAPCIAVIDY